VLWEILTRREEIFCQLPNPRPPGWENPFQEERGPAAAGGGIHPGKRLETLNFTFRYAGDNNCARSNRFNIITIDYRHTAWIRIAIFVTLCTRILYALKYCRIQERHCVIIAEWIPFVTFQSHFCRKRPESEAHEADERMCVHAPQLNR